MVLSSLSRPSFVHHDACCGIGARASAVIEQGTQSKAPSAFIQSKARPCPTINMS
jgi:hypothetical protein